MKFKDAITIFCYYIIKVQFALRRMHFNLTNERASKWRKAIAGAGSQERMVMTKEAVLTGWTIFFEIQNGTGRMVGSAAALNEKPREALRPRLVL